MMISWLKHRWTGLYLLLVAFSGLALFLYGFFPLKYHTGHISSINDFPTKIDGERIDGHEIYNPGQNTVILMVIDGLRYDFVTEEYMRFTGAMIRKAASCIYVAVAEPPTVTMPRIKAMMTGSVSTFADVALNFGAQAVPGDSVLRAAKARNRRTFMYGDDTWLRLFPGLWTKSEGTTSFFVTDYTEVDNNVTRHLDDILKPQEDGEAQFDFLVLHYLGLDHIGHLEGARSAKIKPKMKEMDAVVQKIYIAMEKWMGHGAILLICGDHGMRDAGGHGGASTAELLVPLVVMKKNDNECPYKKGEEPTIAQVDLAPTIAWLLNLPIPGDSTGRIVPSLIPTEPIQHLYLLNYIAQHNAKAVEAQIGPDATQKEFYLQFLRAQKHFGQFLRTYHESQARLAREFYDDSLKEMAKYLSESTVDFDTFAIGVSLVLMYSVVITIVCVTLYSLQKEYKSYRSRLYTTGTNVAFIFVLMCVVTIMMVTCAISETTSQICTWKPNSMLAFIAICASFTYMKFITKTAIEQNIDLRFLKELNVIDWLLVYGTLAHPWSYFGTSFIEEEHMTWYFFWNTLMFFILLRTLTVLAVYFSKRMMGSTEVQEKPRLYEKMNELGVGIVPKWVLLLALHRYLRTMNQTGDRWLFLPDTADWLSAPENTFYLQLHLVVGTLATLGICLYNLRHTNNDMYIQSCLTIGGFICVFIYRIITSSLPSPLESLNTWQPSTIVDLIWALQIAQMIFEVLTYIGTFNTCSVASTDGQHKSFNYVTPKSKIEDDYPTSDTPLDLDDVKLNLSKSISHLVLNNMMLIIVLLMRPHNVIMVPSIYFTCKLTARCLEHGLLETKPNAFNESLDSISQTLGHLWIGLVFFFYQGNSNSLASVDLGSGYVGLTSYSPLRVAARMGLHAYAGPALAGCMLYCRLAVKADGWDGYRKLVWRSSNIYVLQRVYTLAVYLVVATVFRHHLYVWTVFSPKLLYDFVGTFFTIQALLTIAEIIGLAHLTSWFSRVISRRKVT